MSFELSRITRSLWALAALLTGGSAYAGLIGTPVVSQYYVYQGSYSNFGSPASFLANGTVQQTFCATCAEGFTLTVSDSQIEYEFFGDGGFWSDSGTSFNSGGLFIANGNLLTFTGLAISSVKLDSASNVAGISASNITFNSTNIAVDWAGVSGISPGQRIVLDVVTTAASAVPEPQSWLLFFVGSAACAAFSLRRRRAENSI